MRPAPADRCKVPHGLWNAVEVIGIPPAALLRQARLPVTLPQTGQTITTAQYFALMRALEALSGDPAVGLQIVRNADTAVHPPATVAAFYARDLRDGIERLARFKRLCTPETLEITEELDGGRRSCSVGMTWLHASEAEPAASVDATFSTLMELARRGTGADVRPLRVDLARPGLRSAVHETYFAAPVRLGAPRDLLVFDALDLDRPFPGHNPEVLAMLTPALGSALEEMQARSLSEQVVLELKRSLPSGRPDVSEVARRMGMSERTLQRRITEEGRSFRELLTEARRELGHRFLSDVAIELDEIAFLLGYQDATSFHRAFREWEGVTPARWRELRAGDAIFTPH
ncbi:AraC family transcriptional regulator [Phenylobacterium sp.]|uniref:AraC family transcriptional regulator n=1 Tax=Phenylobacterium sp. TaxID=1871053 RepID=UPI0027314471|nr:AraC family transcriptional regulator [Phenylobacterium sp.]MDP1618078.1 AraC family transcriptional regulator ligand-binding domain-containing protein [Phenylobacterium sp.]MDP1986718.1 AraC family transcriptional regulator ligand-binding domain-containing protein [Phenylobacterium sp.]